MDDPPEPGPEPGRPRPRRWLPIAACLLLAAAAPRAVAADPPLTRLEKEMFELVNADRKAHQKPPLRYDPRLADVARAHSTDMLENGFFAHRSPRTGRIADRLRDAEIRVMSGAENIARNLSLERAERRLMKSPGHRTNILSELYSHCGVGIVRAANGPYYITQVFATPAPEINWKTLRADVLAAINQARRKHGRLPLQENATLNRLASEHAAALAKAGKPVPVNMGIRAKAAGLKHRKLSTMQRVTWQPTDVAKAREVIGPRVGRVGLGFAENTRHKHVGNGMVWTVVVFTDD
jgi:uncharacterized protein YkwD